VDVYLALRLPFIEESTLRFYLNRISISLEAQIINSHSPDRDSPPASEIIYNGEVEDVLDFILVVDAHSSEGDEGDDNGSGQYMCVVWKLPVFMNRPRIRLQAPSVIFHGSAKLKVAGAVASSPVRSGYLQSGVPSGLNLLEAFAGDPTLNGIKPRLSALRVSRVAPATHLLDQPLPIPGLQSLERKVYPAVHTRVRFARPNTTPPSPALIALLEVDFTPFFDCEMRLEKITLSVTDGSAEDLTDQDGMHLPLSCVAHDHITFMYRLAPNQLDVISKNPTKDLDIAIEVTALVQTEGPDYCTPKLTMAWITTLDFTLPLNPGFGQPLTQPIQRAHRPSQLSIGGGADAQSLMAPSVSRPDALPALESATIRGMETNIPEFGITMTFTGPSEPIFAGEEFIWTIFVVNRSKPDGPPVSRAEGGSAPAVAAARKLALLPIPKRRRNEMRVVRPPSTSGGGLKRDPLVADAILDENVVHAMQRSSIVDATDVVCLSADLRVGPLAPNACAVVELRFLALRAGVVGVEAVRVIDLATQEHVDIRDLPVIVVKDPSD
jgi:hypothetical protein